tara:strand:- start:2108 stop:2932 length:825 start_codon:yes stop_codon:yes gene_type:complete
MYIWKHIKFDKNGIPIQHLNSNISYIEDNGEFYNPVEITNCAISLLQNYYLLQKDKDKQQFLKYANFCINNLDKNIFYYKFNANHCNRILKKNWYSALSQSQLLVIFSHAFKITKDDIYRETAFKILNMFLINDRNLVYFDKPTMSLAPQEYNIDDNNKCVVMNGMLYSISSFIEFYKIFKDPICFRLIECFVYFLKTHYKCYYHDKTFSYYCLHKTHKTKGHLVYHRLILQILHYLHICFPSSRIFKEIIEFYMNDSIENIDKYIENIIRETL